MANYIDTRYLVEEREELKQQILDDFLDQFEQYADMTESFEDIRFQEEELESFVDHWSAELEKIKAIDKVEEEVGSEFEYGILLISEMYFKEYIEEFVKDCGYISKDFPSWIEIDWKRTADNVRQDYSSVIYFETEYLYR